MKRVIALVIMLAICAMLIGCPGSDAVIVVASKDYAEQYILGSMLALLIEANTNMMVTYKTDLGTEIIFSGIRTGVVDLYVEYTGTVYGSLLRLSDMKCPVEVHEISVRELMERHNILMLDPLGFNNTYALAVSAEVAEEFGLRTISDLANVSSDFIFGGSAAILTRFDGIPNLKRVYDMSFKDEVLVYGVERYVAVANDEIQVAEVYSTDGLLLEFDLVVLEDDRGYFPPYEGAVIIRAETAEEYPELLDVLHKLMGLLSDDIMRNLNYRVEVLEESPRDVAEAFLLEHGLIS